MYTSWWRCFFQNFMDMPILMQANFLHALGMVVGVPAALVLLYFGVI